MALQSYTTGMVGCSWLHPSKRYKVWDGPIQGYHRVPTANQHDCNHAITNNILDAHADAGYHTAIISNAAWDLFTTKKSNEAGFRETTDILPHRISPFRDGIRFITNKKSHLVEPGKCSPLHIAFLSIYHTQISVRQRNGDCSWVIREVDTQRVYFRDISHSNALCVLIVLCVSIFMMSGIKFWDLIIYQYMCNGHTGHA